MWRLTPGQRLRLREFGDESVFYNDLSGDTHLLGAAAIEVLELLGQNNSPTATATLLDSLAAAMGRARDPAFDAEGAALLAQLAGFFLIEEHAC